MGSTICKCAVEMIWHSEQKKNTRRPDDEGGNSFYGVRCGQRTGKEVCKQLFGTLSVIESIEHTKGDNICSGT
ncbi:jg23039 [Pararge aegeria aegeria]|uniref:Jg23039 protein n=1 Tax=Pararge aegeria aegeria TaxID=348720 RepID=A0A8S4S0L5_9NEOP|nr:jg23039 [Pararge aegeria aegeria]